LEVHIETKLLNHLVVVGWEPGDRIDEIPQTPMEDDLKAPLLLGTVFERERSALGGDEDGKTVLAHLRRSMCNSASQHVI